ncbi:uncharacterized protein LOC122141334 [Cyprinus carpio]|uniref:Uncharacterized protein LOC122141334 n=1 Tax=Cyprinus carpio TaxID=7962 RepID=A0A9Q9XMZ2_CYPCA|nr:uncharacterized protein LOC122141334 [Cyprinus carpio]
MSPLLFIVMTIAFAFLTHVFGLLFWICLPLDCFACILTKACDLTTSCDYHLDFFSRPFNKDPLMESTRPKSSLQNTSPGADPADVSQLLSTIEYQKDLLNGFQHQLLTLQASNEHLTRYIQSLPAPRPDPVRFALPDKFDGSPDNCTGFLRQCSIYFSNQPETYRQDHTKCSFIMTLLTGKALEWATAVWDHDTHVQQSYNYFTQLIRDVFQYPAGGMDAATQLTQLRQVNLALWNPCTLEELNYQLMNGEGDYSISSASTVVDQAIAVPTVLLNLLSTPLQVINVNRFWSSCKRDSSRFSEAVEHSHNQM